MSDVTTQLSLRFRRLKALMIKETFQIIRDPSSLLIGFFLPVILMFLYGYGVSLDLDHLRLGLVLEDTSPEAQNFAQSLLDSKYFDTHVARDRRELQEDMIRGNIRGIVIIPSYFSQFRLREDQEAPIQILADGSEPNTASFVQNYVQGAYYNWLQQQSVSEDLKGLALLQIQARFWYNEQLESRYFVIPGSLAIIMTLVGTLLTALVVSREWEHGTMEALMSTPVTIGELLFAKLIPYYILGMLALTMCLFIIIVFFAIPFRGSFLVFYLVSSIFLLTALGVGLIISTVARNQFVASQAALVTAFLPGFILSGFIYEIASMPLPIRMITYLLPARYFVTCLQTLFLVGNVWSLIIPNTLAMLIIGALLYTAAALLSTKRLD
jgi:ABC-2 type transport system permease protein